MIRNIVFFLFLILISACQFQKSVDNEVQIAAAEQDSKEVPPFKTTFKYNQNIRIQYLDNYRIINILSPWSESDTLQTYLLYHQQNPISDNWPTVDLRIATPVKRIGLMSASSIGFLNELNAIDLVKAISKKQNVFHSTIRKSVDEGAIAELGFFEQIDYEQILGSQLDLFIQTPYSSDLSQDDKLRDLGIPVIYSFDWLDQSPLGRAEWIKFFALFIDKEAMADSVFNGIEAEYLALKDSASNFDPNQDVLVGALFKDIWYMPNGKSYKVQLLNDAGSNYFWKNTSGAGSLSLALESVIKNQLNAPIWIEAPYKTYEELIRANSRYGVFAATKNKRVFNHLKQMHADGANNYWERGICRPNEILSDLIRIFHPQEYKADFYYYEALK